MTDEQHAKIALLSLDEELEDIKLKRSRHNDIRNNVNIIKDALLSMQQLRERIKELEDELIGLRAKKQ